MLKSCLKIFFITVASLLIFDCALAAKNKANIQTALLLDTPAQDSFDDEFNFEEYSNENKLEIYDPLEKINRKIYVFNDQFDRYFLQYVVKVYRSGVPNQGRKGIRNFLNNLTLPLSAINSLLQGKVDNSLATFSNFLINSTLGGLGFADVAGEKEIFYNYEDFGQTMGYYNIGSGAYLMLPLLGPSTLRDFSGYAANRAISPDGFNMLEIGNDRKIVETEYLISLTALSIIDTRESLTQTIDDIRKDSFDPYATVRSVYLQRRANETNK